MKNSDAYLYGNDLDCNRCGKRFKRRKDLNYHIRHLCGIRGIQCPYCNKCYTYSSNVKYHISRNYQGERYVKWNNMGYVGYTSEKNYLDRYRYHPNERKRFECLNCGCRFTQKTTMTRHLRYFCGQGHRYQCPYCEMKASCSSNIYRHVRSRHAGYKAHAIKLFSSINPRRNLETM
ncbi:zinc finger protein 771-like [Apis dorsata]|uniref:zinc finger protein 771-like n=1 Tax=Apis dorsata TaxID=7462 RepID=UPI001293DD19|nr:zinc finger protein 771-like [Apis dorsata]